MTHGSLFSGIGGFDLAAEWMGWENKFHCEWNEFGQKVLHYYWPEAELFTDITKSDFTKYANKIDVLTGGFPCQPYSVAGKRLGKEDDRHLWPEMLRAIQEIKPRWVVGENVRGIVNWNGGLVFNEVQVDLENQGYEVQTFLLPACGVNAPHRRDRIWFVAYSDNNGYKTNREEISKEDRIQEISRQTMESREFNGASISWDVADSDCKRYNDKPTSKNSNKEWQICKEKQSIRNGIWSKIDGYSRINSNTNNKRLEKCKNNRSIGENRKESHKQFARQFCSKWENFPTISPVCNGDDGLSNRLDSITFPKWRNESIKAGGNAIVPQVVYQIFKTIEQYEHLRSSMETN